MDELSNDDQGYGHCCRFSSTCRKHWQLSLRSWALLWQSVVFIAPREVISPAQVGEIGDQLTDMKDLVQLSPLIKAKCDIIRVCHVSGGNIPTF